MRPIYISVILFFFCLFFSAFAEEDAWFFKNNIAQQIHIRNETPSDCPFEQSCDIKDFVFTGAVTAWQIFS